MTLPARDLLGTLAASALAAAIAVVLAGGAPSRADVPKATPPHQAPPASTTVSVAAKKAPHVPASQLPILLVVDTATDPGWNVAQAAQDWNDATNCQLFTLVDDGRLHEMVYVSQEDDLMYEGAFEVGGMYATDTRHVYLNPEWMSVEGVAAHELGHVAGLDHHHDQLGVMSDAADPIRTGPSSVEAALARSMQADRC